MNKVIYSLMCGAVISLLATNADAFWHRDVQRDTSNTTQSFQIADTSLDKKAEKSEIKAQKAEKHNLKAMKKAAKKSHSQWLARKSADINEDFDEAIYKIGKTSMPQELKDLLIKQAQENKTLALKQASEVNNQLKKQSLAREKFHEQFMNEKMNKKIIKRIDEIIK